MILSFQEKYDLLNHGKYQIKDDHMLDRIGKWVLSHYNNDSECDNKICIGTLDNPGFSVDIYLPISLHTNSDILINEDINDENWAFYYKRNNTFEARCSIFNFKKSLCKFLSFIFKDVYKKSQDYNRLETDLYIEKPDPIAFLQEWYFQHCDGDWEHTYGIKLTIAREINWILEIDLCRSILEEFDFNEIKEVRSQHNHVHCFVEDLIFKGVGGPENAEEMLDIFQVWVRQCQAVVWQEIFIEVHDMPVKEEETILDTLQRWYALQCNGDWEHHHGVSITPLESRGFAVSIDLEGTEYEGMPFLPIQEHQNTDNWLLCTIRDKVFYAECSIFNLEKVLALFFDCANSNSSRNSFFPSTTPDAAFQFLQNWFHKQCNGDWEHKYGPQICTTHNRPGWVIEIDVNETSLANKKLETCKRADSLDNHYHCYVENSIYKAYSGLFGMSENLQYFQWWVEVGQFIETEN